MWVVFVSTKIQVSAKLHQSVPSPKYTDRRNLLPARACVCVCAYRLQCSHGPVYDGFALSQECNVTR